MPEYDFFSPTTDDDWRAYHEIRRLVLFEARGRFGVYDENHSDERAVGNHPKLLSHEGHPVGVLRIDIAGSTATLRRVAVRNELQRRGYGRVLLSQAQQFARANDCKDLISHVALDAVGFYEKCGFALATPGGLPGAETILMLKRV